MTKNDAKAEMAVVLAAETGTNTVAAEIGIVLTAEAEDAYTADPENANAAEAVTKSETNREIEATIESVIIKIETEIDAEKRAVTVIDTETKKDIVMIGVLQETQKEIETVAV